METPTPQTEDEIIDWLNSRGNGDPDENGIPLDALRENRRLTPRQRVEKLEAFVYGVRLMRAHARPVRCG